MPVELKQGMVFAVNSNSVFAKWINFFQKVKALDHEAVYNHAGIITSRQGRTFEALKKIGYGDIDNYAGCKIIIACHRNMTPDKYHAAWLEMEKLNGKIYPYPRLFLHLVGLAKFIHWKYPVCSELVAKFEFEAGLRKQWWGYQPDNLADEWQISKYYEIIYEGEWEGLCGG